MNKSADDTAKDNADDQLFNHDGMLWKPRPAATVTFDEFVAAQELFTELHEDEFWNPWVMEDRRQEYEAALAAMGQWTRAEPGFRQLTKAEWDAQMRQMEEEAAAEAKIKEERRQARIPAFDKTRHEARLQLLECEAQLRHLEDERTELASRTLYPAMPESRREDKITDLDQTIASVRAERDSLSDQVGDPETVIDQHGNLPSDRRRRSLLHFRLWREQEVRELRSQVNDINTKLAEKGHDRQERSALRSELSRADSRLRELLELPRQTADDMCSECATPMVWHGYVTRGWLFEAGPCPAWPDWAKRIKDAREILLAAMKSPPVSPAPTPQPIAVIPSGLPIADIMKRLAEIQAEHPEAEVRRGARNKWEVWPARSTGDSNSS